MGGGLPPRARRAPRARLPRGAPGGGRGGASPAGTADAPQGGVVSAGGRRTWYHTIDLPDGTATPGWFDTRAAAGPAGLPPSLAGRRCLDVGTFDGFWAFEMERRGAAEVVALDVDDPAALDWSYDERERGPELMRTWGNERGPGFAAAAEALGSRVQRVDCSVYD